MQQPETSEKYELMSDEELVGLYQSGVPDAFGELSVRYIVVIRNRSSDLYHMGIEAEDLFQEGLIALHTAVSSYCEGKGASFRTYATVCIRNRLVSAVRAANNSKNRINNIGVSLEEQLDQPSDALTEPENALMAGEEVKEIMELARSRLSVMEREVLALFIDGNTYEQIAGKLGITVKACDNAMQRVRRKLKEYRS